jgi:hypothetical protein
MKKTAVYFMIGAVPIFLFIFFIKQAKAAVLVPTASRTSIVTTTRSDQTGTFRPSAPDVAQPGIATYGATASATATATSTAGYPSAIDKPNTIATGTSPSADKDQQSILNKINAHNLIVGFPNLLLSKDIGAKLTVCNIGANCSGDMGNTHWVDEATITVKDTKRGLSWSTSLNSVTTGLLQISLFPFNGEWPGSPIYTQNISIGDSVFDFSVLRETNNSKKPTISAAAKISNTIVSGQAVKAVENTSKTFFQKFISSVRNIFLAPINFFKKIFGSSADTINTDAIPKVSIKIYPTYHIRVVPLIKGKMAGKPTNEIIVKTVEPPEGYKFYIPPKAYDIKIKEFQPMLAPDKGVCAHAMIMDTDGVVPNDNGAGFHTVHKGDRICPKPFMGIGEKAWYEQLWDALKSGLSWVSEAYNKLKSAVVSVAGSLVCAGDETCTMALSAGLDIGLAAMGIPPTIPNFDQLMNGGMDYLAGEIASQVGCPDAVCKALIKEGLQTAIDQTKNTNPSCAGAAEAHAMGIEPLCLPANVKAHWDPAATYRDAKVVLEVSRNYVDAPELNMTSSIYKIYFRNWAYNTNPVGGVISNIEPYNKSMTIDKPLEGELFKSSNISIPYLQKGEKIEIPINLVANEYWVPGHKELMEGWSTVIYKDGWPQYQYDDWWMLYYGGEFAMTAIVDGCPYGDNMSSCVISSDSKNVTLPSTLNP